MVPLSYSGCGDGVFHFGNDLIKFIQLSGDGMCQKWVRGNIGSGGRKGLRRSGRNGGQKG